MRRYRRADVRRRHPSYPDLAERLRQTGGAHCRCSIIRLVPWLPRFPEDVQNAAASLAKVEWRLRELRGPVDWKERGKGFYALAHKTDSMCRNSAEWNARIAIIPPSLR